MFRAADACATARPSSEELAPDALPASAGGLRLVRAWRVEAGACQ